MLIILSDLHLNDGTTGEPLSPEAFALFADRLRELAMTASWRSDGAYRPIERIDLVLLGDVFDLLHSTRWHTALAKGTVPFSPAVSHRPRGIHRRKSGQSPCPARGTIRSRRRWST